MKTFTLLRELKRKSIMLSIACLFLLAILGIRLCPVICSSRISAGFETLMTIGNGGGSLSQSAMKAMDYFTLKSVGYLSRNFTSRIVNLNNNNQSVHILDFKVKS